MPVSAGWGALPASTACPSPSAPPPAPIVAQELDLSRAEASRMLEESELLRSENAALGTQCDLRAQHCVLLVEDNRRLLAQVAALQLKVSPPPVRNHRGGAD